ncbi:MAG: DUF1653 domain-containing protein [Acetatifactor sp.]|nr:DUF1653 domain-containing protein [Acetatifactor sp.]
MSFIPKPQEIYKHFKGNLYQITAVAEHTETGETLVVYQALYGDFKTYARPLAMFTDRVDREKYPDADQEFRFELQGPEAGRQRAETEIKQDEQVEQTEQVKQTKQAEQAAPAVLSVTEATDQDQAEEINLDPLVLEFLDADGYEQRLNILAGLHHRITDDMITTMAIACDVEINDGDVETRYESLKNCLLKLQRYECNRLR